MCLVHDFYALDHEIHWIIQNNFRLIRHNLLLCVYVFGNEWHRKKFVVAMIVTIAMSQT